MINASQSEISVISCLINYKETIGDVIERVLPADFQSEDLRIVYTTIINLAESGKPFDIISLAEKLGESEWLAKLGEIAKSYAHQSNISHYVDSVIDSRIKRQAAMIAGNAFQMSKKNKSGAEIVEYINNGMIEIESAVPTEDCLSLMSDDLDSFVDELEQELNNKSGIRGLPTGISDLDKFLKGLIPGGLYIIAGRPAMGKTVLAENIVTHNSLNGRKTLLFSLEMSKKELRRRTIANVANVPLDEIQSGRAMTNDNYALQIGNALGRLKKSTYGIDEKAGASIAYIRSKISLFKRKYGLDLVAIDYLQLVTSNKKDRFEEVSFISRELKKIAKDFNIPVVALSQLSRECEKRQNKRPVMSDLRESGQIEQDADAIFFVYRDEVYNEQSPAKGLMEILCGKSRHTECKDIVTVFKGECQKVTTADYSCYEAVARSKEFKQAKQSYKQGDF